MTRNSYPAKVFLRQSSYSKTNSKSAIPGDLGMSTRAGGSLYGLELNDWLNWAAENGHVSIGSSIAVNGETFSTVPVPIQNTLYYIDASLEPFQFKLPKPTLTNFELAFKKVDSTANAVTITPYYTDEIDGESSLTLFSQWESAVLVTDGVDWYRKTTSVSTVGGSSSLKYSIGNNAKIQATRLGVTSSLAGGTLTVTVPNDTEILRLEVIGDASYLSSGSFKVHFSYSWDNGFNEDYLTMSVPSVSFWDYDIVNPSTGPSSILYAVETVQDPPSRRVIQASGNDLIIEFANIINVKWGVAISI